MVPSHPADRISKDPLLDSAPHGRPAGRDRTLFRARLRTSPGPPVCAAARPEYLRRELFRALEAERQMHGRRTYVPTVYRIQLSNSDVATLAQQPTLANDLAEAVRAYARGRGYVLGGKPVVHFESSAALEVGAVEVRADANRAPSTDRRRPNGAQPLSPARPATDRLAAVRSTWVTRRPSRPRVRTRRARHRRPRPRSGALADRHQRWPLTPWTGTSTTTLSYRTTACRAITARSVFASGRWFTPTSAAPTARSSTASE